MEIGQALSFAQSLADATRSLALRHFRTPLDIAQKADASPVTVADRAIESELRRLILERYPSHGIVGEEHGSVPGTDYTWILDPIDGTKSFVTGNPLFGTLIGLLHGDAPLLGVIDIPALGERWQGDGKHATFNDRAAVVSGCQTIEQARLYRALNEFLSPAQRAPLDALSQRAAVCKPVCDCYAYGLLASGHCDLVIEVDLKPYDYLPLVPVVEGAGGRMTDWKGNRLNLRSDGRVIAAASQALLDTTLNALGR